MGKRRTISAGGITIEAEELEFKPIEEPWGLYELEGGIRIRVRLAASRIFKLMAPDSQTGDTAYYVIGTTINKPE